MASSDTVWGDVAWVWIVPAAAISTHFDAQGSCRRLSIKGRGRPSGRDRRRASAGAPDDSNKSRNPRHVTETTMVAFVSTRLSTLPICLTAIDTLAVFFAVLLLENVHYRS